MSEHFDPFATSPQGFGPGSLPRVTAPVTSAQRPWADLIPQENSAPPSAVLALFIPGLAPQDPASLVLTRRSTLVRSHKGQISFAGGRRDSTDPTPATTALRELEEELGVPARCVEIRGMLEPISGMDGTAIFPVFGTAAITPQELQPSASEVAAVLTVPWPCVALTAERSFDFNLFGNWRTSWLFHTPSGAIWGLTALILHRAGLA